MTPAEFRALAASKGHRVRPGRAEELLQRQIASAFAVLLAPPPEGPVWTAVNPLPGEVTPGVAGRRKAMGLRGGWPDLQLLYRSTLVTIEVKAGGSLDEGQRQRRDEILAQGGRWYLARSLDEALAALDDAGIPRRGR